MRSVVILGAGGYIGSRLTRKLSKNFKLKILVHHSREVRYFRGLRNVRVFSGDVRTTGDVETVIQKGDVVINLSGTTTLTQEAKKHFDVNVTGQHVVAEVCARKGARVIYFSTAYLYASGKNSSKESDKVYPLDVYSLSKKLAEDVYEFYSREFSLPVTIFRLGSVYGPGQKKGVVFTMARSLKACGVIEIPRQTVVRSFIYIDDVVFAVEKALRHSRNEFNVFNITGDEGYTLRHVATMICTLSKRGRVVRVDGKPRPEIIHASNAKARKELKFRPIVSLETGLRQTLPSYKL